MQRLKPLQTRSTGTVDTSAKACLTSVMIHIATKIQSFVHWPFANIPWKFHANPFGSFCAKLLTDRQTDQQRRKHNLLGGGNNIKDNYVMYLQKTSSQADKEWNKTVKHRVRSLCLMRNDSNDWDLFNAEKFKWFWCSPSIALWLLARNACITVASNNF